MKKNQIILFISFGIIIAVSMAYFAKSKIGCNIEAKNNIDNSVLALEGNEIKVSSITNTQDTKYAKVRISYPKFEGILNGFNEKISADISSSLAEFNKYAEENWKSRIATKQPNEVIDEYPKEDEKFEYMSDWNLVQMNDDIVSVLTTTYQFSGGAHGSTIMKSYNYDVKNQKEITLSSLFKDDPDFLNKISKHSIDDLISQLSGNEMSNVESIREGAGPVIKNFEIFTISKNKLTFYFPQYSIGPYALGIKTVDLYNWKN